MQSFAECSTEVYAVLPYDAVVVGAPFELHVPQDLPNLRRTERRLKREDVRWRSLLAGPANPDAAARMQRISLEIEPPLPVEDLHSDVVCAVAEGFKHVVRPARRTAMVSCTGLPSPPPRQNPNRSPQGLSPEPVPQSTEAGHGSISRPTLGNEPNSQALRKKPSCRSSRRACIPKPSIVVRPIPCNKEKTTDNDKDESSGSPAIATAPRASPSDQ